jgi:hypothetical protein
MSLLFDVKHRVFDIFDIAIRIYDVLLYKKPVQKYLYYFQTVVCESTILFVIVVIIVYETVKYELYYIAGCGLRWKS